MNKFLDSINEKEEIVKNESFQKEQFHEIKPDRTKYYYIAAIALVVMVGAYFLLNQKVTVTNFVGWTVSDARTWASSNELNIVVHEVYDDSEVGEVISQNILEGEKLSANSSIELEVSIGFDPQEVIDLPDFDETWTKTKVTTWLNENGITNFTFINVEDETKTSGTVIGYDTPETVSDYIREQAIEFEVTILPTEVEIVVADFLNYTVAQIDAWAADNDVKVYYVDGYSDTTATGKVLTQSIDDGEIMNPGDSITVTLSIGPAIKMVNFTNYDSAAATDWAKDNGIDITVINEYHEDVAKDVAIWQSIPWDKIVAQGTDLEMYYSLGDEITIGSYVGSAITNLESFVEAQNDMKAGLSLNVTYSYSSTVAINKIISQSVRDDQVHMGSTIDVMVSLGNLVTVPDFSTLSGVTYDSAIGTYNGVTSTCTTSKLTCKIVFEAATETYTSGKIISQSQVAGTNVSDSTVIEVKIAQ